VSLTVSPQLWGRHWRSNISNQSEGSLLHYSLYQPNSAGSS
jgi:hypothetical protein